MAILPGQRQRFFDDDMLAGLGGGDGVVRVLVRIAADRDDVKSGLLQHLFDIRVSGDLATVFEAELGAFEFARGVDCGDLRVRTGVNGCDMGGGDPAVADDADIVFLHKC